MSTQHETIETKFIFDEPLECVRRAIHGLERNGFNGTSDDAINILQVQFPSMSRNELNDIYRLYGDV